MQSTFNYYFLIHSISPNKEQNQRFPYFTNEETITDRLHCFPE